MPAIYHEGSWLGNATDPEVLVKDTVGWTGKNRAYSQTNNAVVAHIENGITYDVSWTDPAAVTLKKNSASGATITSGSTSPLSFTADADYELYFGSSATVTNIMVKDSRITDPAYEPYHESVEVMYEEEIHGVNLLKNMAVSKTEKGITFTVNADGSVTVNGTASGTAYLYLLGTDAVIPNIFGGCKLTGCPSGGSGTTYGLVAQGFASTVTSNPTSTDQDKGSGTIVSPSTVSPYIRFYIRVQGGTTVNNLVFRPMIRKADIEDSTYRPYNPQAIQNQLNTQGVLGAKNLLPYPYAETTLTRGGITFTVNSDGSVTANGTATADTRFQLALQGKFTLPSGEYILTDGTSGSAATTYIIDVALYKNGAWIRKQYNTVNGVRRFTLNSSEYDGINIYIQIRSGITVSNLVFKPMLRLASDPDDTYRPYAMTNRELTEKKINIADLKTVVSASSDFADFKTRIASL